MSHLSLDAAHAAERAQNQSGTAILIGSVVSYFIGVVGLVWLILAMAGIFPLGQALPMTDSPALASLINIGLLFSFALQHSVMARPAFKRWSATHIPKPLERSLYVLASGVAIIFMLVFWQPLEGYSWQSEGSSRVALWAGFLFGWGYLFAATFAINHFDLFGLRQAWFAFRGQPYREVAFKENWMYRYSRHPIMLGALIGHWCVPDMSHSMLFFSIGMTLYVAIGLYFEERDLIRQWGQRYQDYRQRVGLLLTLPGRK